MASKAEDIPDDTLSTKSTSPPDKDEDGIQRPTGLRLYLIFVALCMSTLLVAIDATIIATAIPTITAQFHSLADVSWYNSAFLLTTCGVQLPWGRCYSLLSTKWTFLAAIVVFEIGSAIAGAAPSSFALIMGRAVQGLGGGGIFGGAFQTIAEVTPLEKRSLFTGFIGATFWIASVVGPLLGGAFTDTISWRWCFYINLPLGAVALVLVVFLLPTNTRQQPKERLSKLELFWRFDPIGTAILIPSIISLLLALTWGGSTYAWSHPKIIGLLVCFGGSSLLWIGIQAWNGEENATVPWSIAKRRSVACAVLYMFCGSAAFSLVVYHLPIWFQAIEGDSAVQSGIHNLPIILSVVVSSIAAGGDVAWLGYYVPFLILGSVLTSVGGGLLMTLGPNSGTGAWIRYQILFGGGVGMSLEQCNIAIQTVLPESQVASGNALSIFARSFSGSLGISIAQNAFSQALNSRGVESTAASGSSGVPTLPVGDAAKGLGEQMLLDYNFTITRTFMVALVFACLSAIGAVGMEWKSVKKNKKTGKEGQDEDKNDDASEDGGTSQNEKDKESKEGV